jgi:hypothetical protein
MLGVIIILLITINPAVKHTLTDLTDDAVLGILSLGYALSEPFKWIFKWLVNISMLAIAGLATYACAVTPWKDSLSAAVKIATLWTLFIGSILGMIVGFNTGSAVLGWAVTLSGAVYTVIACLVSKYLVRPAKT